MRGQITDDRTGPVAARRHDGGEGLTMIPNTRPTTDGRPERAAIVAAGQRTPPERPKERPAMSPSARSQPRPTPISRHRRYEERFAMTYQPLAYINAESRRQSMLAEAERERTVAQARAAARTNRASAIVVAALRRAVGTALILTGERLQGARAGDAPELELDATPPAGVLRLAR